MEVSIKKVFTLKELETLKDKYYWTIIDRKVYNLKCWIHIHPGGDLVLKHILYKDSTDEFHSFHPDYVESDILPKLCIGVLDENEKVISDSNLSKEFRKLVKKLKEKKMFETSIFFYFLELFKCLILFILSLYVILIYSQNNQSYFTYLLGAFLLGACWHQLAFVGHDLGHNSVSHELMKDHFTAIFLANFCGGISIGWWKDTHYVHHVVTNNPEHDPDIQHLPFLAVSTKFFKSIFSTYHKRMLCFNQFSKALVKIQNYMYYIIMMFGRFNLYVQSILFLLFNKRARFVFFELSAFIGFFAWYSMLVSYIPGIGKKLFFIFFSNAITALLHVQITISHFAMSTDERNEDEEFVKHQLRTTMDVSCLSWLDWLHGGLQFQVIHHLFPRMSRHNLRAASLEVLKFCNKHNLEYKRYSFISGNVVVLNHLGYISKMIK